jgi:hypothetical protein
MARRKRTSTIVETARHRLAGYKTLKPSPDFGGDLTVAAFEADIQACSDELDGYNQDVVALDERQIKLDNREKVLRDKNRRILAAAEAKFGSNSAEHEALGGTRESERKRPVRRSAGKSRSPSTP